MFKNVDSSNNHPCPAAYVGESYQLHCPAVSNQEKSLIVWNREDSQNRSYGEVSRCYFNSTCFTKNTSRIYVNATSSWKSPYSYTINSTYTILNVTEEDRDTVISCAAIYDTFSPSKSETIMSCQLPVFTVPPSCQASLYMPDVSIVCYFPKVHPRVKCEFGYEKNVFKPEVPVDYEVTTLTNALPDYYKITCKRLLKFEAPYQTRYYVRFTPIYLMDIIEDGDKNQSWVEVVALTMSPKLVINSPTYITICPPNLAKNVSVYCSVTSLSPRVILDLFLDNVKVIPQKPPTYISSQLYITMQEYRLLVDTHFQNKSLRCESDGFSYDSAEINLPIPPNSNPLFTLNGGMVVNHINVIPENFKSKLYITCHFKNRISLGSNITVICSFPNGTWYLNKNRPSSIVFFTIYGEDLSHDLVCNCSAHQDSDCYTKYTILTISVEGANANQNENQIIIQTILMYILIPIAALVIVVLAIRVNKKKCGRKNYTSNYIDTTELDVIFPIEHSPKECSSSQTLVKTKFVDQKDLKPSKELRPESEDKSEESEETILQKSVKTIVERHTEDERLDRAEGGVISDIQTVIDNLKSHRESQDINYAINTEQYSEDILTPFNPSTADCWQTKTI